MTRQDFDLAVQKICAAFVFPEPSEAALAAWYQLAGQMSLQDAAWVVNEFISRNSRLTRGVNIGRELKLLHDEYERSRQGKAAVGVTACPDCSAGVPGWIRVLSHPHGDVTWSETCLYRCACNHDPRFAKYQAWTREQLQNFPFLEVLP